MVFETLAICKEGVALCAEIAAPLMNLPGPELVCDLVSLIQQAEADHPICVLVSKSADPAYFISHVDVTRIREIREAVAKLTGEVSLGLLFHHLSASRLVTIVQIEGRVRGVGSEFVLACDIHASPNADFRPIMMPIFVRALINWCAIAAGAALSERRVTLPQQANISDLALRVKIRS